MMSKFRCEWLRESNLLAAFRRKSSRNLLQTKRHFRVESIDATADVLSADAGRRRGRIFHPLLHSHPTRDTFGNGFKPR